MKFVNCDNQSEKYLTDLHFKFPCESNDERNWKLVHICQSYFILSTAHENSSLSMAPAPK